MTTDDEFLARRFEAHRGRLLAVAHRMLGSSAEAEDAVQEAWFRLSRSGPERIDNLGGWLTTVVGRVCLDLLRSRGSRAEQPLDAVGARPDTGADPERDALLADSVGVALLVVLENLTPAERLAFVLHDLFAVDYEEIATVVGRTPGAARQLASRARRRVRGARPSDADPARQRAVVDAFLAAAREGDIQGLVDVLDPDVVAHTEAGVLAGAREVAGNASRFAALARLTRPALVDGRAGLVLLVDGRPERVLDLTVVGERIAVIDIVKDPERLARMEVVPL
ncbi:sigma-70 family RNA polymerase sigma factor [Streptomyces sp. NPDC003832]